MWLKKINVNLTEAKSTEQKCQQNKAYKNTDSEYISFNVVVLLNGHCGKISFAWQLGHNLVAVALEERCLSMKTKTTLTSLDKNLVLTKLGFML